MNAVDHESLSELKKLVSAWTIRNPFERNKILIDEIERIKESIIKLKEKLVEINENINKGVDRNIDKKSVDKQIESKKLYLKEVEKLQENLMMNVNKNEYATFITEFNKIKNNTDIALNRLNEAIGMIHNELKDRIDIKQITSLTIALSKLEALKSGLLKKEKKNQEEKEAKTEGRIDKIRDRIIAASKKGNKNSLETNIGNLLALYTAAIGKLNTYYDSLQRNEKKLIEQRQQIKKAQELALKRGTSMSVKNLSNRIDQLEEKEEKYEGEFKEKFNQEYLWVEEINEALKDDALRKALGDDIQKFNLDKMEVGNKDINKKLIKFLGNLGRDEDYTYANLGDYVADIQKSSLINPEPLRSNYNGDPKKNGKLRRTDNVGVWGIYKSKGVVGTNYNLINLLNGEIIEDITSRLGIFKLHSYIKDNKFRGIILIGSGKCDEWLAVPHPYSKFDMSQKESRKKLKDYRYKIFTEYGKKCKAEDKITSDRAKLVIEVLANYPTDRKATIRDIRQLKDEDRCEPGGKVEDYCKRLVSIEQVKNRISRILEDKRTPLEAYDVADRLISMVKKQLRK